VFCQKKPCILECEYKGPSFRHNKDKRGASIHCLNLCSLVSAIFDCTMHVKVCAVARCWYTFVASEKQDAMNELVKRDAMNVIKGCSECAGGTSEEDGSECARE